MSTNQYMMALAVLLLWTGTAATATIHVPDDQATIQGGIDVAVDGDFVLVAPGTYLENIDFLGKRFTLRSEEGPFQTIIDGGGFASVVSFVTGEPSTSVIEGFTIKNGFAEDGGGITMTTHVSPTIRNCRIVDNIAFGNGGGISCTFFASPVIENCVISGNEAAVESGGIDIYFDSYPEITNCVISDNTALSGGGLTAVVDSSAEISHSTIAGNTSTLFGGAMTIVWFSNVVITNSIVWGNTSATGPGIHLHNTTSEPAITYSDIQGGWPGEGNIEADPLFTGGGDYHLTEGSPAIDTATASAVTNDIDGDLRPQDSGYDMGADEYTPGCRDQDGDGYLDALCGGDDCEDTDGSIHPGAEETSSDGIDSNCNGPDNCFIATVWR